MELSCWEKLLGQKHLPLVIGIAKRCSSGGRKFLHDLAGSEYMDHPLQFVGRNGDPDLGLSSAKTAQQQAGMAEDTVLECAAGMLFDSRSSSRIGAGVVRSSFRLSCALIGVEDHLRFRW